MYKTLRIIHANNFLVNSFVRHSSQNASIKSKKIGLVGMGNVGDAVLKNLQRNGFVVSTIYDIYPEKCKGYDPSIQIKSSPKEVAEESDVIISGLPHPKNVYDAFSGKDGIFDGLKPGAVWIDHSTTDYGQNKFFTEQAAKKEAHVLECPITGGLHALQKGQMAVWVAGEKNIFESVKPVLDASYSTVLYTGGVGSAMIPKVVSNMLCFLQVVAMGEVLMVAKKSGMELDAFWHFIRASAGNSFLWETCGPNVFRGDFHDSFALELACKDIRLFAEMAKDVEVPTEIMDHMQKIYLQALEKYGNDVGCYTPPRLLEDKMNETLRVKGFENWTYDVDNVEGALEIRHKGIDNHVK